MLPILEVMGLASRRSPTMAAPSYGRLPTMAEALPAAGHGLAAGEGQLVVRIAEDAEAGPALDVVAASAASHNLPWAGCAVRDGSEPAAGRVTMEKQDLGVREASWVRVLWGERRAASTRVAEELQGRLADHRQRAHGPGRR